MRATLTRGEGVTGEFYSPGQSAHPRRRSPALLSAIRSSIRDEYSSGTSDSAHRPPTGRDRRASFSKCPSRRSVQRGAAWAARHSA